MPPVASRTADTNGTTNRCAETGTPFYAGAVPVDPGVTETDPDSAFLSGATVSITGVFVVGQDVLAFTNQDGITGVYNGATGVLTLTGNATIAQYQAALRSVTYAHASGAPGMADVRITKTGPANATLGSSPVYTITVTNSGSATAENLTVSNPTPTGLTFVSNSGACTTVFPCALGSLGAGQTRVITTILNVPNGYAGPDPIRNVATVSSTTTADRT